MRSIGQGTAALPLGLHHDVMPFAGGYLDDAPDQFLVCHVTRDSQILSNVHVASISRLSWQALQHAFVPCALENSSHIIT